VRPLATLRSYLRHRLWRLGRKHPDDCGGSPYKPCGHCTTPDWCRKNA